MKTEPLFDKVPSFCCAGDFIYAPLKIWLAHMPSVLGLNPKFIDELHEMWGDTPYEVGACVMCGTYYSQEVS